MYSTPAFAITSKGRQDIVETLFISSECSHDSIRPLFIDEVSTGSDNDRVAVFLDHYNPVATAPGTDSLLTTPPPRSHRSSGKRLVHRVRIPRSLPRPDPRLRRR